MRGQTLTETSLGNFLILGFTTSPSQGSNDILIIEVTKSGVINKASALGLSTNDKIQNTKRLGDNYVAVGVTDAIGGSTTDALLISFA